jgi:hypothetical protein
MKIIGQSAGEVSRQRAAAIVARHVHEIFRRLPTLSGFWLSRDCAELSIVACHGYTAGPGLFDKVMQSLLQIIALHPHAEQFMRGRTFARSLH